MKGKSPRYGGLTGRITTAWGRSRNSTNSSPTAHEIKAAVSPRDFYLAESTTMPAPRRDGWVDGGLCHFHDDHNTGNFRVNTVTGAFKRHACGAGMAEIAARTGDRTRLEFVLRGVEELDRRSQA